MSSTDQTPDDAGDETPRAAPTYAPPCVILHAPQLAENIGAVARVMANFGLYDLRMVRPRDGWPQERAWASASGADWPLDNAKVFETLEEACGDLKLLLATTARPRETFLPVWTPREAAAQLQEATGEGLATGLLFGGERAGLETADIALCHGVVTIPIDDRFRSLNLAQAVAINAYEWRMTVMDRPREAFALNVQPPADQAAMVGLYEQLEHELDEAGFYHPPEKRPSMVRNLRVALGRSRMNDQEVRTMRGVITALSRGRGRVLAKLAAQKAAAVASKTTKGGDD
ncbi:MAG: rRNA methyltransferase [Caulobacter sp.]|nr:rRNA methyltransferase [Caulobacter sp.]